jgi:signal peptidase
MRWLARGLTWSVILAVAAVLVTTVVLPRVAGGTPYTVLTGSMKPDLGPGTLVVVRPVDPGDVGIGTVITYQLKSGEPTVVTHRVVAVAMGPDGEPKFQTQGDANEVPDAAWVRPIQIKGQLWYSVPMLGRANTLLNGEQRQWAIYGVAALLLGYAAQMWVGAYRHRRLKDEEVRDAPREAPAPA